MVDMRPIACYDLDMEASTTQESKYREGLDDGAHARTCWDTDPAYVRGWITAHDELEARNIRAWLGRKRLAQTG